MTTQQKIHIKRLDAYINILKIKIEKQDFASLAEFRLYDRFLLESLETLEQLGGLK